MQYIILLGAFQSLMAMALFISARNKKPADNLLNCMLACLFTHLSIKFIIYGLLNNEALKVAFNTFIDFAYGPLLWMYAKKVSTNSFQPKKYWYHFLPTLLAAIVYFIIAVNIFTGNNKATPLINYYNTNTNYLIILSFLLYPLSAFKIAGKLPKFWLSERRMVKRISLLFLIISTFSILTLLFDAAHLFTPGYFIMPIRITAYLFLLIISLLIIQYRIATQYLLKNVAEEPAIIPVEFSPETAMPPAAETTILSTVVFTENETQQNETNVTEMPARKFLLTEKQQQEIATKLIDLNMAKKVFTDPELTLEKLSTLSQIPRNHISETLNQYVGKSFYQFINEFRIAEVVKMLDRCKKQALTPNILSLAFEAGFQSKTSFNQYFKKHTGLTPSDYLKKDKTQFLTSPATRQFSASQMAH